MIALYLDLVEKDVFKEILKTSIYMIYRKTPLTSNMQYFINYLGYIKGFDDGDFDEVYTIDTRYEQDISLIIRNLTIKENKLLLFFLIIFAEIFEEIELTKYYNSEDIFDEIPLDSDSIEYLIKLTKRYVELTDDIYNLIYDKKDNFFQIDNELYKEFFLIDFDKIETLTREQREAFLYNLALIMYEKERTIDRVEDSILDIWEDILGVELKNLDFLTVQEVDLEKIKKELKEPWLINFFIFSYYLSKPDKEDSTTFNIFDLENIRGLLSKTDRVLEKYKEVNIELFKFFHSSAVAQHSEEFATIAEVAINGFDLILFFLPVPSFVREYNLINSFRKAGDIFHTLKRLSNSSSLELETLKESDSKTTIICINGYLSENRPDQFDEWLEPLNSLNIDANIKGFKWISNNIGSMLSSGVATWYQSVKNSYISAKTLLKEIEKIYESRADSKIILMGHSLGARVIFNMLHQAVDKDFTVDSIYLFGGAVPRKERAKWLNVSSKVKNGIYNFYSKNDKVLKNLYQSAMFAESPIGLGEILTYRVKRVETNIVNFDLSYMINGHSEYKDRLDEVLKLAKFHKRLRADIF